MRRRGQFGVVCRLYEKNRQLSKAVASSRGALQAYIESNCRSDDIVAPTSVGAPEGVRQSVLSVRLKFKIGSFDESRQL